MLAMVAISCVLQRPSSSHSVSDSRVGRCFAPNHIGIAGLSHSVTEVDSSCQPPAKSPGASRRHSTARLEPTRTRPDRLSGASAPRLGPRPRREHLDTLVPDAAPTRSVDSYMFSTPMRSAKPVTRNCSARRSFNETTTSFEPTPARLSAYPRSTSMNVEPISLRSRKRRITTALRDWGVGVGRAAAKSGAAAKKRLPYGWSMTTSLAGRRSGGSDSMTCPSSVNKRRLTETLFDWPTTYRAMDMATPARTAYCNGMRIVNRNVAHHHDSLRHTGFPDRGQVGRLDRSDANDDQADRQARAWQRSRWADQEEDDDCHYRPSDHERHARACAGRLVER